MMTQKAEGLVSVHLMETHTILASNFRPALGVTTDKSVTSDMQLHRPDKHVQITHRDQHTHTQNAITPLALYSITTKWFYGGAKQFSSHETNKSESRVLLHGPQLPCSSIISQTAHFLSISQAESDEIFQNFPLLCKANVTIEKCENTQNWYYTIS